ncbi:hypothetical protein FRC06_001823 [Ceratobasidium sp. 370]|nr:hypothetical protein FRC06_001823 [Ceratobasidium sp. 370]
MKERGKLVAGSGPGGLDDGLVSPLRLSPTAAFPSLPDLMEFGLLRRSASVVASGSGRRPAPQRSHSAQPRPGNSPHMLIHPPRTPTSELLRLASLPLTSTSQSAQLLTPASRVTPSSGFHGRTPRAPSWRADSASPISAQRMHMHALALQNSESVMGALVYRPVDELSLSGDENELFGTKESISGGPDPATLQSVRGTSGSAPAREAMVMRGGMSSGIAGMGMGNMTALYHGGGSATVVTVTSLDAFKTAISNGSKVIIISGSWTGNEVVTIPSDTTILGKSGASLYEELINAHTGAQYCHLPPDDRLYLLSLTHIEYPTPPPSIHAPAMSNTGGASNPTPANTSASIISDRNYSISKLEGHDNYCIQMEDMFQDADVWDIVEGRSTRPTTTGDPQTTWDRKNMAALGALRCRIDTGPIIHVARATLVSDAWNILKTQYQALGITTMTMLRFKFTSL